ncbi:MAG: MauE/DoxX family redox-associated membrane protein [Chitinophagaceae bacterium]
MKKPLFTDLVCGFLIILFLYTALSKFFTFNSFKANLTVSPLISSTAVLLAWLIPLSEVIVTILLFVSRTRLVGMFASLVLLFLFTFYLLYIVVFHANHLPCTCGGVISKMSWKQHILFNSACIVLVMLAIISELYNKLLLQQTGSKLKTYVRE